MSQNIHQHRILILDFGSQYTQLIARRVRELGVYCEIHAYDIPESDIKAFNAKGIILSGGPETVTADTTPRVPEIVFQLQVPVLGICYGMQAMATQLGGRVASAQQREFGFAKVIIIDESPLFKGLSDFSDETALEVWMSHGDHVTQVPKGFTVIGKSDNAPIAAMACAAKQFYALQFHPEVTHTRQGKAILSHFVHDICGCAELWTPQNIIDDAIAQVRATVGDEQVILGLSGGVDSSVVAALLHKAIDKQLTCIFIDNGLLRLNESEQVMETFAEHMGVKVIKVEAADRFLTELKNVSDPEEKRKIIGRVFIEIFEEQAEKIKGAAWLAQGTIYPDVIESAASKTGKAHVIKSHHNVGGLPEDMNLKLLEPLRELFKDEVRKIGEALGLSPLLVYRHPFPGPGLAVRVLGAIKQEYLTILRKADAIFIEELQRYDLYANVSQAFAVFLPVKSVGVMGDARRYDYVVCLRAVETIDFMTARWAHLPYEFLETVSNRIINEVPGISRVTYDVSSKPPATIEWE